MSQYIQAVFLYYYNFVIFNPIKEFKINKNQAIEVLKKWCYNTIIISKPNYFINII